MHIHFLDPYQPGPSLIHRLDARVKLTLIIAFILTTSLTPMGAWAIYLILLAILVSAELLSELGIRFYVKRAVLALPFVLAAFPLLFTIAGQPLWEFRVGAWVFQASVEGGVRFLSIAIKSWISVQAAVLLAVTTPFPDLLLAMRALRLPRMLVAIFGLMWRYIFVLADEALRLMRARSARSSLSLDRPQRAGRSVSWRAKVTGGMAGSLFLRAFERADRIYVAMLSRGYDGEVRSLPLPPFQRRHWISIFVGISLFVFLLLLAYLLSGLR
ncbi:MAG: cobalt ECF transporter T component CbiQ [Chloroflexota bacterium]